MKEVIYVFGASRRILVHLVFRQLAKTSAVGPIVAAELEALGVQVNIMPRDNTFFMKALIRELAAALMKDK
jgi:uroporphyrinogen-III synthase